MSLDIHNGATGTYRDRICISNNDFTTDAPQNGTVKCDIPESTFNGSQTVISTSNPINTSVVFCEVVFYGKRNKFIFI